VLVTCYTRQVNKKPWSDPESTPLEDVREVWIRSAGVETIRLLGYGPGSVWFRESDGSLMPVETAIERYGPDNG
jgi:hypothetical protein